MTSFKRVAPRALIASLPLALGGCPTFGGCPERPLDFGVQVHVGDLGLTDAGCARACDYDVPVRHLYACAFGPLDADLGVVTAHCRADYTCVGGRRPAGFDAVALSARDDIGAWLARAAALEGASVPAFAILGAELRAHGAPTALVAAAARAADDERRHAALVAGLARRYGAVALPQLLAPRPIRPLDEIAIENAVEGLTREAFAAHVAAHQAEAAADPAARAVFASVAPDELRHAALAAAVDAWAASRLPLAARRRVAEARAQARAALAAPPEPPSPLRHALGLPDAAHARRLLAALA